MKKIVHVVGTGTIGEPLIGLFADFGKSLGIDEVTFHKRTPMITERAKVNHLVERGAKLIVDSDKVDRLRGARPQGRGRGPRRPGARDRRHRLHARRQREQEAVREDQGPARVPGPGQRVRLRQDVRHGDQRRGADPGTGPLPPDRLLQHPQHRLPHHDAGDRRRRRPHADEGPLRLHAPGERRLAGLRLRPGPSAGKHDDPEFGTHHARDASALLSTLGWQPPIFSSAMKLNTQYMHSLWFDMELAQPTSKEKVLRQAAREPAHRADGAALLQPDLLVRPRPRLLRPHPVAGGHLGADASPSRATARSSASASRRRTATRSPPRSRRRSG